MDTPVPAVLAALFAAGVGARVVVRYRVGEQATDALGELLELGATTCVVATRRGPATIEFSDVIAAKPVPPPAQRRPR